MPRPYSSSRSPSSRSKTRSASTRRSSSRGKSSRRRRSRSPSRGDYDKRRYRDDGRRKSIEKSGSRSSYRHGGKTEYRRRSRSVDRDRYKDRRKHSASRERHRKQRSRTTSSSRSQSGSNGGSSGSPRNSRGKSSSSSGSSSSSSNSNGSGSSSSSNSGGKNGNLKKNAGRRKQLPADVVKEKQAKEYVFKSMDPMEEPRDTTHTLATLNEDAFIPQSFVSTRKQPAGSSKIEIDLATQTIKVPKAESEPTNEEDPLFHPNFFGPDEDRMTRWVRRLHHLRQSMI